MSEQHFYTTQLQAGLGLIEETRLLLGLYEAGMTASVLSTKALNSGLFPNVTARRLHNIVSECFAPRYLRSQTTSLALKLLAEKLPKPEFNQLLFIHTARSNLIFADFVRDVFWSRYSAGRDVLDREDAKDFVTDAVRNGKTQIAWSESTVKRVGSYLLGCCSDYELLEHTSRGPRRILPLRLYPQVAAYLAYDLKFQGLADNQIVNHSDWQLFGLEGADVRDQLKRLSLDGYLIMQSAAEVIHISWTYKSMDEVIDALSR